MKLRDYLNLCESYELDEKFVNPYAPGPHRYNDPWRTSPSMRALQKSDELLRTEPGSRRQKLQTKRSEQLNRLGLASKQADLERKRLASLQIQKEELESILDYLINEGFADSYESAGVIYENMSDTWLSDIFEGFKRQNRTRVIRQYNKLLGQGKEDQANTMLAVSSGMNTLTGRKAARTISKANQKKGQQAPHLAAKAAALSDIQKYGFH